MIHTLHHNHNFNMKGFKIYLSYLIFIIGLIYVQSSECEIQRSEIGELYDIYDKDTCTINYVESENITTNMIFSGGKCYQTIHMVNASLPYYKNGNCVDEIQEIHDGWVLHLNEKDYIKIDKEHSVDKLHVSLIQQFILFFMLLISFYTLVMCISCIMKLFTNTSTYLVGTLCFCEQRFIYIRFMLFISRIFKLGTQNPENGLGDICVICHEDMELYQRRIRLGCKHVYHRECILEWVHIKQECPIDRIYISLLRDISFIEPIYIKPTTNHCEHIA